MNLFFGLKIEEHESNLLHAIFPFLYVQYCPGNNEEPKEGGITPMNDSVMCIT